MSEFAGFGPAPFRFLAELEGNNERPWFEANKQRYEAEIREPARAFVRAVGARLGEVTAHLAADDRKMGGSLMRIYRDTRFGKDKTPYKTNVGIQFRHAIGKDVHAPGLYVHLANDELFVGVGTWGPDAETLQKIRTRIVEHEGAWRAAVEAPGFTEVFERMGESLKRAPKGCPADHPLVDDLKRKHHIASCPLDDETAESPALVDFTMDRLQRAAPYMRFVCEAIGVPF